MGEKLGSIQARVRSRRYLTIPWGIEGTSSRVVDITRSSIESIHFKYTASYARVIDPETKCDEVTDGVDDILIVRGCALTILRSTCYTTFATMQQQTFYPSIDLTKSFTCQRSFRAAAIAIKARDAQIAWLLENVRTISRVHLTVTQTALMPIRITSPLWGRINWQQRSEEN